MTSNITSISQFYDILQVLLTANKRNRDYDKSLPRQARIDAIIAELATRDTNPPPGYSGQKATWKHEVKSLFRKTETFAPWGAIVTTLYRNPTTKDLEENRPPVPITPAENAYAIIVNSHLENGHHLGRDATFAKVSTASGSITKEMVNSFVKACPGCSERTKAAQMAYTKRSHRDQTSAGVRKSRKRSPRTSRARKEGLPMDVEMTPKTGFGTGSGTGSVTEEGTETGMEGSMELEMEDMGLDLGIGPGRHMDLDMILDPYTKMDTDIDWEMDMSMDDMLLGVGMGFEMGGGAEEKAVEERQDPFMGALDSDAFEIPEFWGKGKAL